MKLNKMSLAPFIIKDKWTQRRVLHTMWVSLIRKESLIFSSNDFVCLLLVGFGATTPSS